MKNHGIIVAGMLMQIATAVTMNYLGIVHISPQQQAATMIFFILNSLFWGLLNIPNLGKLTLGMAIQSGIMSIVLLAYDMELMRHLYVWN